MTIDQPMADELSIYILNDERLYNQCRCCALNLARKHKRGIYDPEKAVALFTHVVAEAARRYRAEFGPIGRLSRDTKRASAADLLERFEEDIQEILGLLNAGRKLSMSDVTTAYHIRDVLQIINR